MVALRFELGLDSKMVILRLKVVVTDPAGNIRHLYLDNCTFLFTGALLLVVDKRVN